MPAPDPPERPPITTSRPFIPAAPPGPTPPRDETAAALREIAAGLHAVAAAIKHHASSVSDIGPALGSLSTEAGGIGVALSTGLGDLEPALSALVRELANPNG